MPDRFAVAAAKAPARRVAAAPAAGVTFGPPTRRAWYQDADGKAVASVSVDATGVGPQTPRGAAAEGRRASAGMLDNPVPDERARRADPGGRRPHWRARSVAQVRPLAPLAEPLRRQGGQVGMDQAARWAALCDGGSGRENCVRSSCPRVAAVLRDFGHVAEYLGKSAEAWHPGRGLRRGRGGSRGVTA